MSNSSSQQFNISILAPTRIIFEGKGLNVNALTKDGEILILPGHADLCSLLDVGIIKITTEKGEKGFFCFEGMLNVKGGKITILTEEAKTISKEVLSEIREAMKSAKTTKLTKNILPVDLLRAESQLRYYVMKRGEG
jgi:F-type H+-transporting ATPase subunit epsilon